MDRALNTADMTDSQFLRHIAHTAEIGDPIEERDIERIRKMADERDSNLQTEGKST